jgi:SAM-dependent methyltransferase
MIYLPEVPDETALAGFYSRYAEWKGYTQRARRSGFKLALDALRDVNIAFLEQTGGLAGRKVLEVGASYGYFLERARWKGATVEAVEIDADARAQLSALGIPAHDRIPKNQKYDVVCAFQLLEHLSELHESIAALSDALAPDGRLLVGVPNAGEAEKLGPAWVGFRVDLEHLNYFTASTLARLFSAHGLYVEQHWQTDQPGVMRPNGTEKRGRLRGVVEGIGARLFRARTLALDGRYVLTVLARRT